MSRIFTNPNAVSVTQKLEINHVFEDMSQIRKIFPLQKNITKTWINEIFFALYFQDFLAFQIKTVCVIKKRLLLMIDT